MTIGKKRTISAAMMLAVTLVLGVASLRAISQLSEQFKTAVDQTGVKIGLIAAIDKASSDMLAGQRGVVMFTNGKRSAANAEETASAGEEMSAQTLNAIVERLRQLVDGQSQGDGSGPRGSSRRQTSDQKVATASKRGPERQTEALRSLDKGGFAIGHRSQADGACGCGKAEIRHPAG
jgi:CHASE3 domain sensor protein